MGNKSNEMKFEIRSACSSDAELLSCLGTETFCQTYAHAHPADDMSTYLELAFNKEKISQEISDKNTSFLIAESDKRAIAYAKLTSNKKPDELKDANSIELERFYVEKSMTAKGIGKKLFARCLDIAKTKGFRTMWLSVWEHNPKAISFYEKFGFEVFGSSPFTVGKTKRTVLLMKKEISAS